MKELNLINEQLKSIEDHPGNISSNLGTNLPFKEKLEDIINNSASVHSEFNVALQGICNVVKKIKSFVNHMQVKKIDSRSIKGATAESQYYPNSYVIDKHDFHSQPVVNNNKSKMQNIQVGVAIPKPLIVKTGETQAIKIMTKPGKAKKAQKQQAKSNEKVEDKKAAKIEKAEMKKVEKAVAKSEAKKQAQKGLSKKEIKKAAKALKKAEKAKIKEQKKTASKKIEKKENKKVGNKEAKKDDKKA